MKLVVEITEEQAQRLKEIVDNCDELTVNETIGAMIDLDYEEWQDAVSVRKIGAPRSTRWCRFVASERD